MHIGTSSLPLKNLGRRGRAGGAVLFVRVNSNNSGEIWGRAVRQTSKHTTLLIPTAKGIPLKSLTAFLIPFDKGSDGSAIGVMACALEPSTGKLLRPGIS